MANKNFPVTYYQTLTEVFWPLRRDVKILQDIPFNLESIQ